MRIEVYEILSTNSLSGSRITINDNFKMLEEGLNNLYEIVSIDDDTEKVSLTNIEKISTKLNQQRKQTVCMKIDQTTGHLILLDENGELALDVNQFIIDSKNNQHSGGSESESESGEEYDETAELMEQVAGNIQSVSEGGTVEYEYIDDETAELMGQISENVQSVSEGGTVEYEYINE